MASESNVDLVYGRLLQELRQLFAGERDAIANLANCAAALYHGLDDLNWAGFYRRLGNQLVLGPFQGRPACIRIDLGRGVCGTAAVEQRTMVVPDVHAFAGHIACDAVSRSEIVIPLIVRGQVWGVMDLDSPRLGRFSDLDRMGLEQIAQCLVDMTDLT